MQTPARGTRFIGFGDEEKEMSERLKLYVNRDKNTVDPRCVIDHELLASGVPRYDDPFAPIGVQAGNISIEEAQELREEYFRKYTKTHSFFYVQPGMEGIEAMEELLKSEFGEILALPKIDWPIEYWRAVNQCTKEGAIWPKEYLSQGIRELSEAGLEFRFEPQNFGEDGRAPWPKLTQILLRERDQNGTIDYLSDPRVIEDPDLLASFPFSTVMGSYGHLLFYDREGPLTVVHIDMADELLKIPPPVTSKSLNKLL